MNQRTSGREWLFLGLLGNLAVALTWGAYFPYFLHRMEELSQGETYEGRDALFAQLDMVSNLTAMTGVLASIAMVIGLAAVIRSARGPARGLAQGAMVTLAITMAVDLFFLFFQLRSGEPLGSTGADLLEWARYVNVFAPHALMVLLALALHRASTDEGVGMTVGVAVAAVVAAAVVCALGARDVFGEPGERSQALMWISRACSVTAIVACALLARRLAVSARGPDGWPRVARGFDLFGKALVARVALGLAGTLLIVFAAFAAKSISMVKVLTVLVPLTNFACLMAMAAGAIRVASAPEPASVRGITAFAALLLVAAAALGCHVMIASYKAFDGGNPGAATAMQLMKQELAAGLCAMVAIALVLDAARRIALQYGEIATAQRAMGLLVALVVVIGGQVLLQYKPFLMKSVSDPGTAVFFLLAAAIVVLVVVLMTGRLARDLVGVIERGAPPARAIARVVD